MQARHKRENGRVISQTARYSQKERERIAAGNCRTCGKPRGRRGTLTRCAPCRRAVARRRRAAYRKRVRRGLCTQCGKKREVVKRKRCNACLAGAISRYKQETE